MLSDSGFITFRPRNVASLCMTRNRIGTARPVGNQIGILVWPRTGNRCPITPWLTAEVGWTTVSGQNFLKPGDAIKNSTLSVSNLNGTRLPLIQSSVLWIWRFLSVERDLTPFAKRLFLVSGFLCWQALLIWQLKHWQFHWKMSPGSTCHSVECANVQTLGMDYPTRQEGILVRSPNHLGQTGGYCQKEVPPILCKVGRFIIYNARWTHRSKRQDYYCSGFMTSCAWGLSFILLWNWEYEIFSTTHRMVDRAGCESRTPC